MTKIKLGQKTLDDVAKNEDADAIRHELDNIGLYSMKDQYINLHFPWEKEVGRNIERYLGE